MCGLEIYGRLSPIIKARCEEERKLITGMTEISRKLVKCAGKSVMCVCLYGWKEMLCVFVWLERKVMCVCLYDWIEMSCLCVCLYDWKEMSYVCVYLYG